MASKDYGWRSDCKFFKGYIPCRPHKEEGVHCEACSYYKPLNKIILIIKLGAIGDVIRTTPLLHKIWKEEPQAAVWWLTYSPAILPGSIDRILTYDAESLAIMQAADFDTIINLDKDPQAVALAKILNAKKKLGFTWLDGRPAPADKNAEHKFLTGLFDDVNQANTKSYPEEIFEICGWKFDGEEYILDFDKSIKWDIPSGGKTIVGLNTGCGDRWRSRLWAEENWEKLIAQLDGAGYFPMLLGGAQEDEKNLRLSQKTGAFYPGHFSLKEFISLMGQCDTVVTAVTMGLHIAVGLKKNVILMNNIFNPHEFELYGRGEIVQPEKPCTCFFSPTCKNPDYFCMDSLKPETILEAVKRAGK